MLAENNIGPAQTDLTALAVLVLMKDGTRRFCVDYLKRNAVGKRDVYPIPRVDQCIDSLGNTTIFLTVDANSGYWQIQIVIDDKNKDKARFISNYGLYCYERMPFGLCNAPETV